jgi:outer membrane protein OmpA-like peptidoglycan-associated protein
MKPLTTLIRIFFTLLLSIIFVPDGNAQVFKKLKKAAERAAERTVERRVEKESSKKTDEVLDSILEPESKGETPTDKGGHPIPQGDGPRSPEPNPGNQGADAGENDSNAIVVYSKFDFVPGDKLLFFDDFSNDFVGDFPSRWNTNGGGELVQIGEYENKWLKILPGFTTVYIPDVSDLPEEFTLEFDVIADGLDQKTSSQSYLRIVVSENTGFEEAANFAWVEYPFCQYAAVGTVIENKVNGKREIRNDVDVDIRDLVTKKHHISLAVNQQRLRFWLNERKLVDVPRLLPEGVDMKGLKIKLRGVDINKETVYFSNFKVAEGGLDLRRTLLSEGKVSTNGILFDSGSANIQPQSMGIILQISQVLQQESGMNLNIIGHTDSDGEDTANMELSRKRAEAVKTALINVYNIAADRLQTDGKGESEPVGDNGTPDGKAQNRRVEFIKQ